MAALLNSPAGSRATISRSRGDAEPAAEIAEFANRRRAAAQSVQGLLAESEVGTPGDRIVRRARAVGGCAAVRSAG